MKKKIPFILLTVMLTAVSAEETAGVVAPPVADGTAVKTAAGIAGGAAVKAEAADGSAGTVAGEKSAKKKAKGEKAAKAAPGREAVITADRTDYDRKEGVILFDRNVHVDDEQYQMHADRLFVFLEGTNDLKRLVAIGHVAMTNEDKTATCNRAVYTKATSKIVMYGDDTAGARLHDASKKGGGTVEGRKITFWLNSEEVEVEESTVRLPSGSFKGGGPKELFNRTK